MSSIQIHTFPVGQLNCNCSILYSTVSKDALVIDPGCDAKKVSKFISDNSLKVSAILHTHAHFDHIGESSLLTELVGSRMYLHRGDQFLYDILEQQGKWFGMEISKPKAIDDYLNDSQVFKLDQHTSLEVMLTPGHTPGSCSFYLEGLENPYLFSGDTLFQNSIGRTDLPGGDSSLILKSIKQRLLPLPDETICIPGHGPQTSIYHEKKHNPYL